MKIAITGDNHLDFLYNQLNTVKVFVESINSTHPDIVINLGDFTNGRIYNFYPGLEVLLNNSNTLYVLGNHDLWSQDFHSRRQPNQAFSIFMSQAKKYAAIPLEKSFSDKTTYWQNQNVAVVGTIGFPDFEHPKHIMPKSYYELNKGCTNDVKFMDLSKGWLHYTRKIKKSFASRLDSAIASGCKHIIVATHYPIFDGQSFIDGSDISAYFFCHGLGKHILSMARQHLDVKFWCFSAHSHEYCNGRMSVESENVVSYGLKAEYERLAFASINTDDGFEQQVSVREIPERYRFSVIESH